MRQTLSVALCTYNGAAHLEKQLDSLTQQTRLPDELVVRDDASSDDSVAIVRAFAARAPFPVRIYEAEHNAGYVRNFEEAIQLCQGDLIALSDQDDVWLPKKLELLEEALKADSHDLVSFSDAALVDGELNLLGQSMWQSMAFSRRDFRRAERLGMRQQLLKGCYVTGAAMCFRSSILPVVLPLPLDRMHDAWIALLASYLGKVIPVPQQLMLYRQHGTNQIGAPGVAPVATRLRRVFTRDRGVESHMSDHAAFQAELYESARGRLIEHDLVSADQAAELTERVRHARFRTRMLPYPARASAMAKESPRYARFSTSPRNFARDCVR